MALISQFVLRRYSWPGDPKSSVRTEIRWLLLTLVTTIIFYWKITLSSQFSLLTASEGVNQAFSWLQHWIRSVRAGSIPVWDMYTFSGRSFPGEMQTAVF